MTTRRLLFIPLMYWALVSCAHRPSSMNSSKEVQSFRASDPEPPKLHDQELETIPVEMNARVEQWINYFQGRGRVHMERYLARSTRYSKLMKRILRQNGLPEDLLYIALIESGFSSRATSRAAAVGYWQFIRSTGKRYGLEINSLVDERRDPVLSTQAAAEYFKGLYSVFGSWYLAMASYNVGENRVKREVMNHYTRDFWELARKRRFPKETINYIPKYLAAKLIANDPEKYGFTDIEYEQPIEFELVKLDKPINLRRMAEAMGLEYEEFKQLNPKFKGEVAPLKGSDLELRIPIGQTSIAMAAAEKSYVDRVEYIADAGETQTYKVRRGDSLYLIARKYRTTVAWLRDANDIPPKRKLRIGMRLQVPDRGSRKLVKTYKVAKAPAATRKKDPIETETATVNPELVTALGTFYVVQPGDTLSAIADDYDSSVNELRKMNKLSRGAILRVGMKLRVPKDEGLPADPSAPKAIVRAAAEAEKSATSSVSFASEEAQEVSHVVRPGENLTLIAKKYGVTVRAIQKENRLGRRSILKVGAKLKIPTLATSESANGQSNGTLRSSRPRQSVATKSITVKLPKGNYALRKTKPKVRIHVVRNGENLTRIASKYDVSLNEIIKKNRISDSSKLFVGAEIVIPN